MSRKFKHRNNNNNNHRSNSFSGRQSGFQQNGLARKGNGFVNNQPWRPGNNQGQKIKSRSPQPMRKKLPPLIEPGSDNCPYETIQISDADKLMQNKLLVSKKLSYPMINHGNTCFFNAVMQCLTHTIPFHQYMLLQIHQKQCQRKGKQCYQCDYSKFIGALQQERRTNLVPILRTLPAIWPSYRVGQQRDAHEFLTIYLEAILNSCYQSKPTRLHVIKTQTETPIFNIFGGKLRSQINCLKCNYKSDTFDETFTLNLPLPRVNPGEESTFNDALKQFCKVEHLTKDNKYLCPKCTTKQNATKRMSINQAPRILIVTVKRFDIFGRKIRTRMRYPANVNLKKFTDAYIDQKWKGDDAENDVDDVVYDLYGVVIHAGSSTCSGHYYSYCKTPAGNDQSNTQSSGKWSECNDEFIRSIPDGVKGALGKEAYLLFYQKRIIHKPKRQLEKPSLISSKADIAQNMEVDSKQKVNTQSQPESQSTGNLQITNSMNSMISTSIGSNSDSDKNKQSSSEQKHTKMPEVSKFEQQNQQPQKQRDQSKSSSAKRIDDSKMDVDEEVKQVIKDFKIPENSSKKQQQALKQKEDAAIAPKVNININFINSHIAMTQNDLLNNQTSSKNRGWNNDDDDEDSQQSSPSLTKSKTSKKHNLSAPNQSDDDDDDNIVEKVQSVPMDINSLTKSVSQLSNGGIKTRAQRKSKMARVSASIPLILDDEDDEILMPKELNIGQLKLMLKRQTSQEESGKLGFVPTKKALHPPVLNGKTRRRKLAAIYNLEQLDEQNKNRQRAMKKSAR